MRVIDCRFRPLVDNFISYIDPEPANFRITKTSPPKIESLDETLDNLEKMNVVRAVVSGRNMGSQGGPVISNAYIADLVKKHPIFIGVAGADPLTGDAALAEIEHSVRQLGLKGVSIDPFSLQTDAADRRFYPIYELCAQLGVPALVTIGPLPIGSGYMEWGSPLALDRVAADFPGLKILASHAGFPYTQEFIAIAWRHENLYFETSIYRHMPGAGLLVEAANTILAEKMCYASAYPYADYRTSLPKFLEMGYSAEALPKILYENAARLFAL